MCCLFVVLRERDWKNLIRIVGYGFVVEETRENGDIYISRKKQKQKSSQSKDNFLKWMRLTCQQ